MIELVLFEKSDICSLLSWLKGTDEEFLLQFAGPQYNYPLTESQVLDSLADTGTRMFKAISGKRGRVVGHCQLLKLDKSSGTAAVGRVLIRPEERGNGYGFEMLKSLIEHAKNQLGLSTLTLKVFDFNKSAIRCYETAGFVKVSVENRYFESINKTWKCITMAYSLC